MYHTRTHLCPRIARENVTLCLLNDQLMRSVATLEQFLADLSVRRRPSGLNGAIHQSSLIVCMTLCRHCAAVILKHEKHTFHFLLWDSDKAVHVGSGVLRSDHTLLSEGLNFLTSFHFSLFKLLASLRLRSKIHQIYRQGPLIYDFQNYDQINKWPFYEKDWEMCDSPYPGHTFDFVPFLY